ncbi:XRE family transcriptional regulator [Streptomyces cyaneochromogenes]|uniref:XRE family transcriptional regulator n=1 Tax=Streptomyces cyaneochromogenes TaxID=2496836 RepID=A0A3Q9EUQ2_9ACTN|nr:helix-turn-helix transcriptional regulator [Streptomyces cyaneochromogenes]AZQ35946.1 XRE family transcriptional regulator [Streptomyces cyaneochromogenes]
MEAEEWKARLVKGVAQQVRRYRLERGISVQGLADICTEQYGLPIKRSVLANFEGGRRPALSVVELIVIARILRVPPAQLLFPVGLEELTEVLPGQAVDPWAALKWFTGEEDRLPLDKEADRQDAEPVQLFRRHDQLTADWRENNLNLQNLMRSAAGGSEPHLAQFAAESLKRIADTLREVRQEMRSKGLTPPPIEQSLAYIDTPGLDIKYVALSEESDE